MSEIIIKRIEEPNAADARLKNEPFELWGRFAPSLSNGGWSYTVVKNETVGEDCFPDENYDPVSDDGVFLGAYINDEIVGLALLRRDMFKYLYLDDLKVCRAARGKGVGTRLIEACMDEAKRQGLKGVYTIGQDTNASACLFYIKQGFEIGGFDNRCYRYTAQENSANVFFYKDLP